MRKIVLISVAIVCAQIAQAQQLLFQFEDNNLEKWEQSTDEHWCADSANALSGGVSLHHCFNSALAGNDMISYAHEELRLDSATTSWEFKIRYGYSPSASNNWSVWLAGDSPSTVMFPQSNATGYIVGVNYTGSDDRLQIWYQSGGKAEIILNSGLNWQTSVPAGTVATVRVVRTQWGEWQLSVDTTNSGLWKTFHTITDSRLTKSSYFGVYYKYTATQDQKLWMDDIQINGYFYKDIDPPSIQRFEVVNSNQIDIFFTEAMDTNVPLQFKLNSEIEIPVIRWNSLLGMTCWFDEKFEESNTLTIKWLCDILGNQASPLSFVFDFHHIQKYDVLISELLADPTPQMDLPDCEYIELYNRTDSEIKTRGWTLIVGENKFYLPDSVLKPKTYYLLTASNCRNYFPEEINFLHAGSMPSLLNDGFVIELYNQNAALIDVVSYNPALYKTSYKREGGWSLERIDLNNPCIDKGNWAESLNSSGGTPGFINSVNGVVSDTISPRIIKTNVIGENRILLVFSEPMDSASVTQSSNFQEYSGELVIATIESNTVFNTSFFIELKNPLDFGKIYGLKCTAGINDCSGNTLKDTNIVFGIPMEADSVDILINEVLYESNDTIPEFIEFYNNSDKVIEMKGFSYAFMDELLGIPESEVLISSEVFQLLPKSYLAITKEKELLLKSFPKTAAEQVLKVNSWGALPNEGKTILLLNKDLQIIDKAVFKKAMHHPMLKTTSGVSLERISFGLPGDDISNWHSAGSSENYATPARPNSQAVISQNPAGNISLSSKVISPDSDGLDDVLTIGYEFDEPGFLIRLMIYSAGGALIKIIANNELCGTTGTFVWDGTDNSGRAVSLGYYIVYAEALHTSGKSLREKLTVLVLHENK